MSTSKGTAARPNPSVAAVLRRAASPVQVLPGAHTTRITRASSSENAPKSPALLLVCSLIQGVWPERVRTLSESLVSLPRAASPPAHGPS